ncbi:uncharacterized protein C19orf44 homolog [Argonauta hians]
MYPSISSANALLNKVSQQLTQSRKSIKSSEDFQHYLKSPKKQTNDSMVKFKDISEISFSSEETDINISSSSIHDVPQHQFLKRDSDFHKSPFIKPSPNTSFLKRSLGDDILASKSFDSDVSNLIPARRNIPSSSQTSSVLDRASKLFAKFDKKNSATNKSSGTKSHSKNGKDGSSETFQKSQMKNHQRREIDESSSDDNIGKGGRRFLKPQLSKDTLSAAMPAVSEKEPEKILDKSESVREVSQSYSGVTSGDESLAEFIGKLGSISEVTHEESKPNKDSPGILKKGSQKPHPSVLRGRSPSPSNRVFASRTPSPAMKSSFEDRTVAESITAEIIPEEDEGEEEEAVEEVISGSSDPGRKVGLIEDLSRMNVFNIDDLEPVISVAPGAGKSKTKEKPDARETSSSSPSSSPSSSSSSKSKKETKKKQSKKQSINKKFESSISEDISVKDKPAANFFSSFGVRDPGELLARDQSPSIHEQSVSSESESVIKTASKLEESIAESVPEDATVATETVAEDETLSESQSTVPSYSEEFDSFTESDSNAEEYTEDFHSVSASRTVDHSSTISTITFTKSRVSKTLKKEHKSKKEMVNTETQTEELGFQPCLQCLYKHQDWRGRPLPDNTRGYVPQPKPAYCHCNLHPVYSQSVVSPNLQAIQEMIRQQVEFTQQFCESQQYLYHSLTDCIKPSHVYVTLEDTKQYIQRHRKPKLTLEEALRQVDLET